MSELYDRSAEIHDITVKREIGYFSFVASDILRDAVYGLLKPEIREEMGSRALFLYSEHFEHVNRRHGVLRDESGRMESAVRRLLELNDGMPLPISQVLQANLFPDTGRFVLHTGVFMGPRLIRYMQERSDIPKEFRQGLSMPVRISLPFQDMKRQEERVNDVLHLKQIVHGDMRGAVPNYNRMAVRRDATARDMKMNFAEERVPTDSES